MVIGIKLQRRPIEGLEEVEDVTGEGAGRGVKWSPAAIVHWTTLRQKLAQTGDGEPEAVEERQLHVGE